MKVTKTYNSFVEQVCDIFIEALEEKAETINFVLANNALNISVKYRGFVIRKFLYLDTEFSYAQTVADTLRSTIDDINMLFIRYEGMSYEQYIKLVENFQLFYCLEYYRGFLEMIRLAENILYNGEEVTIEMLARENNLTIDAAQLIFNTIEVMRQ